MTLARTPYARLSPADIGQVDRELKKLEQMSAGLYVPKVLVAARSPYTVQGTDTMLLCDCTAGPITLTFPLAARVEGMAVVVIKSDSSANAITLSGTFSGAVNPRITVAHAGYTVSAMNGAYHVTAGVTYPVITGETGVLDMLYPWFNVRRYGAMGDAVTNDTTALRNAITSGLAVRAGTEVYFPNGIYLYDSLTIPGPTPLSIVGESRDGVTLKQNAVAEVGITLASTVAIEGMRMENFRVQGNATALGGIKFGTSALYVAYTKLRDLRTDSYTGTNAYGMQLGSIQELDAFNVRSQGNYTNVSYPAGGFLTSAVFHGQGSYYGLATNRGIELAGVVTDITFRSVVIEANAKEGLYSTGAGSILILDDVYVEQNCASGGTGQISVSGTSAAFGAAQLRMTRSHFHSPLAASPTLYLDYIDRSTVEQCDGLSLSTGIVTTAHTNCHFAYNADNNAADFQAIYAALLGTITADDYTAGGARFHMGARIHSGTETFNNPIVMGTAGVFKPRGLNTGGVFATDTSGENAGNGVTILNNATASIGAQVAGGFMDIVEKASIGTGAIIWLRGACAIVWQDAANFSVTSGTAGKINVFNTGSQITIENKTGGTIAVYGTIRKLG